MDALGLTRLGSLGDKLLTTIDRLKSVEGAPAAANNSVQEVAADSASLQPGALRAASPEFQNLGAADLFAGVDLDQCQDSLSRCRVRELCAGETLINRGQRNERMYVVLSGRLNIHLHDEKDAIAVLREGDLVGEMSIIVGQPTSATVKAESDCRLLEIAERILWQLVSSDSRFARNLLRMFARRLMNVNSLIQHAQAQQEKYRHHANTDALTGLYNRRWLNDNLPYEMTRCTLRNRPLSLLIVDIDHFKRFNDSHGHLAGDQALKSVAQALQVGLRGVDMAVRYGGEEIMVILPGADLIEAERVAARLHHAVNDAIILDRDGSRLPGVTVSIGISEMRASDGDEDVILRADAALYQAKSRGRNRTVAQVTSAAAASGHQ
ncbi:MAG: diguanylate cyclase [Gammaproteobacteria bacterium]